MTTSRCGCARPRRWPGRSTTHSSRPPSGEANQGISELHWLAETELAGWWEGAEDGPPLVLRASCSQSHAQRALLWRREFVEPLGVSHFNVEGTIEVRCVGGGGLGVGVEVLGGFFSFRSALPLCHATMYRCVI